MSEGKPPLSLLSKLDMPELADKWPQDVLGMGELVGPLADDAAAHLGLPPGLPVRGEGRREGVEVWEGGGG